MLVLHTFIAKHGACTADVDGDPFDYCMKHYRTPALVDAIMTRVIDPDNPAVLTHEQLDAVKRLMIELDYAGPAPHKIPSGAVAAWLNSRCRSNTVILPYLLGCYFYRAILKSRDIEYLRVVIRENKHHLLEQMYMFLVCLNTQHVLADYFAIVLRAGEFNARLPQVAKLILHGAGVGCAITRGVKLIPPSDNPTATSQQCAHVVDLLTGPQPEYADRFPYVSVGSYATYKASQV